MKKICLFIVLAIACCSIGKGQGTGYVTLKGRQFYDQQGVPFFPMVMNYHVELTHDNPNNPQYKIIRSTIYGTADCELEGGYTFNNCETSLAQDFAKMKQMGFNTIRLVGALSPNRNDSGVFGFHTLSGSFYDLLNNPSSFCKNKQTIGLDAPYTNSDAQSFFNLIAHFMDVAQSSNMKVILLCADGSGSYVDANGNTVYYPDRGSSLADAQDYAAFLGQLANAIKNKPALLAYDLYNEPNYSWYLPGRNMDKNKQTVCDYFALWYDAIKAADPNHLITIGGTDYSDVFHWDTGVMKLDFVSVHYYPERNKPYETERLINQHHWFTEALGKPWIVGETGFAASDESCLIPYLDGDNAAQLSFMQAILLGVRDCGGSGFSIWEFQDKHWYCVPDAVCNPTCANCDNWGGFCGFDFDLNQFTTASIAAASNNILGNYHSLLAYGDPDPVTGLYDPAIDRPAAAFTAAFNAGNGTPAPAPCTAPTAYYYDPYHQGDFNTNTGSYVTGFIQDQDGNPMPNAAVMALNWLKTIDNTPWDQSDFDFSYEHSWIYTFANYNTSGTNFTVIPYTPNHPADPRIVFMTISAAGASKQELGQPYPWTDAAMNPNAGTVVLNKTNFDYDGVVSNVTITPVSDKKNYSGWNTLAAYNVTVQSGVTGSNWAARTEVNLHDGFHAMSGSEAHIFTGETFADCADYTGYLRTAPRNAGSAGAENESGNIELAFIPAAETKPAAEIIPNPTSGIFTIKTLHANDKGLTTVSVKNMMGKRLREITFSGADYIMDMSREPRGIYIIEINNNENIFFKKLVIN